MRDRRTESRGTRVGRLGAIALLAVAGLASAPAAPSAWIVDRTPRPPPAYDRLEPPEEGETFRDPVFGIAIRRLSDAAAAANRADAGALGWVMPEYATVSAFNRDRTRFLLERGSYFGLYDGAGDYLEDLPLEIAASTEPRWSRLDANLLYFVSANELRRYDVATRAAVPVHVFREYHEVRGHGESDVGFSGDRFVLAGDGREVFVFDVASRAKGGVLDTRGRGEWDSLYLTPDDNVLVSWHARGTGRNQGVELFDREMRFLRQVTRANGHMDVTRSPDGDEILVWLNAADPQPLCENGVVRVRLGDASQRCLLTLDWRLAAHVSCPDGDGACVVGTLLPDDPGPGETWPLYAGEILRLPLDGAPPERLAHHRSRRAGEYNYTPRASLSRDGRRLLFSSNFGLTARRGLPAEYTDAYLLALPRRQETESSARPLP